MQGHGLFLSFLHLILTQRVLGAGHRLCTPQILMSAISSNRGSSNGNIFLRKAYPSLGASASVFLSFCLSEPVSSLVAKG